MKIYKSAWWVVLLLTIGLFGCNNGIENQVSIQPRPSIPSGNIVATEEMSAIETPSSGPNPSTKVLPVDKTLISETVNELCATPRKWGTDGELCAGAYIEQKMKSYGYEPEEQELPVYKTGLHSFYSDFFNMNTEQSEVLGYGRNIIFTKPSTAITDETFIISTHYDSINDCVSAIGNASGVDAIMETVRILKSCDLPFNMKFVFFSTEEYYITGSRNYVFQFSENERNAILGCINVDMVGESEGGDLEFRTAEGHNVLTLLYENLFPDKTLKIGSSGTSDDASFTKVYIPALTIAQDNPNYELQKLENDLEFFEPEGCMRAAQLIADFMVSYDISVHEQLLNDMPSQDLDISMPYFSDPVFIFKFSKGYLLEYTIASACR